MSTPLPITAATLALAAALLLGGCGQMGPLYEPEPAVPPSAPAPATQPAAPAPPPPAT